MSSANRSLLPRAIQGRKCQQYTRMRICSLGTPIRKQYPSQSGQRSNGPEPPEQSAESFAMRQMQQQLRQIQSTLSHSQQAKSDLPPYVSPLAQFAGAGQERLPRGLPPCTVPIFKRGGEIPIDLFFFTLEVYFAATYIPENFLVPIAMSRFDASHHIELQPLIGLSFDEFRTAARRMFKDPDLSAASMSALYNAYQTKDETLVDYLERVRTLARKAFPAAEKSVLEPAIHHQFVRGINDKNVAMQLMAFKGDSNALIQEATAIEAGIRDYRDLHRTRSSEPPRREHLSTVVETTRFAPRVEPQSPPPDPLPSPRDDSGESDSEFESGDQLCAAFDSPRQVRGRPRWNRGPRRPPPQNVYVSRVW